MNEAGERSVRARGPGITRNDGGLTLFVVATPPIGAVVPELPPEPQTIVVGNTAYYYAGGAFYVQQPNGFLVVQPPLGVTVSVLPPGAAPVTINGALYYTFGGAYYMPVIQDGVTVYTTVRPL